MKMMLQVTSAVIEVRITGNYQTRLSSIIRTYCFPLYCKCGGKHSALRITGFICSLHSSMMFQVLLRLRQQHTRASSIAAATLMAASTRHLISFVASNLSTDGWKAVTPPSHTTPSGQCVFMMHHMNLQTICEQRFCLNPWHSLRRAAFHFQVSQLFVLCSRFASSPTHGTDLSSSWEQLRELGCFAFRFW